MKRSIAVLSVAGLLLAVFAGGALAQTTPPGTLATKNLDGNALRQAVGDPTDGQAVAQTAATGETLDANNLSVATASGNAVATFFTNGQTFTAEHDGPLTSVAVRLARTIPNPDADPVGDLTVQIVDVDAASGLPTLPEDVLATTTLPSSEVPQTFSGMDDLQTEKVVFDNPASIVAGRKYALVLRLQGPLAFPSNYYVVGTGPSQVDTYAGGERTYRMSQFDAANTFGPWQRDDAPYDLIFGIYGTFPDTTPPEVSSTSPTNNATGVAATADISAAFFEEGSGMDPATLNPGTFKVVRVKPTGSVPIAGTVSYDESSQAATFDPSSNLAKGLYRATITTGIKDNAGNALANSYSWTFTTAGPR